MRRRHGRVSVWVMVVLAVLSLAAYWIVSGSTRYYRARRFDLKRKSVELVTRAFEVARSFRIELGVPIDSVNDPNGTGLVGVQFSSTTWGRSDLSDALTTTNP